MPATVVFTDDDHFHVGSTAYVCTFPPRPGNQPAGLLPVMKPRDLVERLVDLIDTHPAEVIVELGIRGGGSTALIAQLARPSRLVAVEIARSPAPALRAFIAEHGLEDVVRPHYGIDQADRDGLASVVEVELGDRPIDLVIDDASHLLAETRSSFETLFPRLRPGGLFIIEDWNGDHVQCDEFGRQLAADVSGELADRLTALLRESGLPAPKPPLSTLVIELLLACAALDDAIESVTIDAQWVVIRRGPGALDRQGFRLSQRYRDHFDQLPTT